MARIWIFNAFEAAADEGFPDSRYQALAAELVRRGHDATWWSCAFSHFHKNYRRQAFQSPRLRFVPVHTRGYKKNNGTSRLLSHALLGLNTLQAVQRREIPHAIIAMAPPLEVSAMIAGFARRRGIPLCLDVTDVWPESFKMLLPHWSLPLTPLLLAPHRRLLTSAINNASSICAISETYLSWAMTRRKRDLAHHAVVPWASATVSPPPVSRVRARPLHVVFCGTLGITYDLPLLASIARHFDRAHPGAVSVQIVGDGPRRQELVRLIAGTSARYFGPMRASALDAFLRQADVGLCPYVQTAPQSLPIKLYTYLSYGLPVVETLGGEMGALLESRQMGLTARHAGAMVEAIEQLVAHPRRRTQMAKAALAYSHTHDLVRMTARLATFVEGMLGLPDRAGRQG